MLTLAQAVRDELRPWSPDAPNLHALVLSVGAGGEVVDRHVTRFGWRQFALRGRDVLLNGRRLQMFGDLSHPFGPFMMSRRFVWAWYRMIKDFGGNAVRPHAQPYPRAYLDLADEMGIVVLDETALFGSSLRLNFEDPAAWERFAAHYDALVLRDRNHPSVIGWSFGNELFAIFSYNRIPEEEAGALYGRLAELGCRQEDSEVRPGGAGGRRRKDAASRERHGLVAVQPGARGREVRRGRDVRAARETARGGARRDSRGRRTDHDLVHRLRAAFGEARAFLARSPRAARRRDARAKGEVDSSDRHRRRERRNMALHAARAARGLDPARISRCSFTTTRTWRSTSTAR